MSCYELYALKFAGPFSSSGAFTMWLKEWQEVQQRNYYFWCLKSPERAVLVDAGVAPGLARQRDLPGYVNPAGLLEQIGVRADTVEQVILSHLHWDHVNGVSLFPNARFHVQRSDRQFWLHDETARRPPFTFFLDDQSRALCRALEEGGRLPAVDGEREILPGITCLPAPGHSVGLQAVAVRTVKGVAVLGSDCAHLFRNFEEEWPSALIIDLVAWVRSVATLKQRVSAPDLLFPGHDPLLSERYPEVAPGITRLV